jgi:putative transposase
MVEPKPFRWSRSLSERLTHDIRLRRDPAGRYFLSFLVAEDLQPLPVSQEIVGIHLGLQDIVALSTGEKTYQQAHPLERRTALHREMIGGGQICLLGNLPLRSPGGWYYMLDGFRSAR